MLNNTSFANRLKAVMDFYQISASSFAETIEVPRSSISHILSGRNNPSLDFVLKTIETYQEVDLYWLLKGIGSFPKSSSPLVQTTNQKEKIQTSLKKTSEEAAKAEHQETEEKRIVHENEKSTTKHKSKIDKVLVFYTDGTFKEYRSQES